MLHLPRPPGESGSIICVALSSGERPPDERPLEIMAQNSGAVPIVQLQVDRVLSTAECTKTLFVQWHPSPVLCQLTDALRRLSATPSASVLNLHISLLYTHMCESEHRHLAETISLSPSTVLCDAIWAIASW